MLNEAEQRRLAAGFAVYDHEWRYICCHIGEPSLSQDLLVYDDGTVLSLCAFSLDDPAEPVAPHRIQGALASHFDPEYHRLIHIWGVFEPQDRIGLARPMQLVDPQSASSMFEGEFSIDLRNLSFAESPACRKTRRQIHNKGVEVAIARSQPLCAAQLRLVETWRRSHELSPLSVSAGQAIATFVRERQSYTATASVDGSMLGFSVFSCPNEQHAVNLMSFSERVPGSRIDDALQWESTLFAQELGCARFSLGYAGYDGLSNFKRKWGAQQTGPAYRAALYAADEGWRETATRYEFAWISRLHA